MAGHAPDAREFVSWEDAFQYPLPTIRKFEQQLRGGVSDNREKVRALVGSGYRDLLGTADRIIDMNGEMHRLEEIIGDIGRKCNSRVISKISTNHERLTRHRAVDQASQRRPAAEVALLHVCLTACRRLMKDNGDPLLAARLLLLGRLLQSNAAKTPEGARLLRAQRLSLGTLRNRLMLSIDERLAEISLSRIQMLDLLLAYSLVTASSLADVLRHLLRVRQQSVVESSTTKKRKGIVKAIDLLMATLEQSSSVFPRRMTEAMERVTGPHLLQDEALRAALDFDLNIYERWISNDIRSFVPWLRSNDLTKDNLNTALGQWAQNACCAITSGLEALLAVQGVPLQINHLREKTIRHLLEHNTSSAGFDKEGLLMTMRGMFRQRLFTITKKRVHIIDERIKQIMDTELGKDHKVRNLWDHDTSKVDLRRGAQSFRQSIVTRSEGKDASLQRLDSAVTDWTASIEDIRKTAKEMRQTRWADELDMEDNDTAEDGEKYQALLADTDPSDLTAHLTSETTAALTASIEALSAAAQSLSKDPAPGPKALFLLRMLRLIPLPLPRPDTVSTGIRSILHATLAISILNVTSSSSPNLESSLFSSSPAIQLWHAPPDQQPLPVLPSPGPFRLLRAVSKAMTDVGLDVWTPDAVVSTRREVEGWVVQAADGFFARRIEKTKTSDVNGEAINARNAINSGAEGPAEAEKEEEGEKTDGTKSASDEAEPVNGSQVDSGSGEGVTEAPQDPAVDDVALATQALFDAVYLREVLCPTAAHVAVDGKEQSGKPRLSGVVEKLRAESKVGDSDFERLVRNAGAYHRRSYLLFGVLAG